MVAFEISKGGGGLAPPTPDYATGFREGPLGLISGPLSLTEGSLSLTGAHSAYRVPLDLKGGPVLLNREPLGLIGAPLI